MKKSLKRILSLALVIAVLMTSMLVSSVGATTTIDPMQEVLLKALTLDSTGKGAFNTALNQTDINVGSDQMHTLFPSMSIDDAKLALQKYNALSEDQKIMIQLSVLAFSLNEKSYDGNGFNVIIDKVNTEITGSVSDNKGISLIIQILEFLSAGGKNGAWLTDLSSDTSKVAFGYNADNYLVGLAINSLNALIDSMDTLNNKIVGRTEATVFEKLLGYTASEINDVSVTTAERTALKSYLYGINQNYYKPYEAPIPVVTPTPVVKDEVDEVLEDKPDQNATGLEVNAFEKTLAAAVEKSIEAVGTTTVAPTVSGTTATITANQINVADVLAKAVAVIAKATELDKTITGTNVTVEKKIVIDVAAMNVESVNVALPAELLTKVQEKGIESIEIATGDVKINIAPDFAAGVKTSSSIAFSVDKVAVSDELKATMTDEQKDILAANPTVYDLSAMLVSSTGKETKLTNFDKSIKIKIKYTLKAGEKKDRLTVLFLGDDGKIQNMTGSYDETSGEIEFVTNHFSTYVVKNLVMTFNDVKSSAWYKSQAESLAAKGIVSGVKGNNFAPNANITRAEFMTMLVKAKGVYDENATCDFTDVSEDDWYYTYVASAVKAGIADGIGNNKFAPNSLITREQMAVMLANALGVKTIDDASSYLKATDAGLISAFAKNGMALCVKNEFMVGSDNKLDPKGNTTRGMAAVVVYKYFNFIY